MEKILSGLVQINGADIWTEYGVFLVEDTRGGMDNLTEILTPSKTKGDTAVAFREENGEKYGDVLTAKNEARDISLHFALYAETQALWMKRYVAFVNFCKDGENGWLDIELTQMDMTLHVKYTECTNFTPLTYLWKEGVHAGKFRLKFREPVPII